MKDTAVTEFLKLFYQGDITAYVEGDDPGTTFGISGAVVLASILAETKLPSRLAKITGLPVYFAACVISNMDLNNFWDSENFHYLLATICDSPSGPMEIEQALNDFLAVFWNESKIEELGAALVAARGRALLHGKTQHWVDRETLIAELMTSDTADNSWLN